MGVLLPSSLETEGHPEPLYEISAGSICYIPLVEGHHTLLIFPDNNTRNDEECDCSIHYTILESIFWSLFDNNSF